MARHVTNQQVADLLVRYQKLMELAGEDGFRVRAYQRAADALRHDPTPVEVLAREHRLTNVPGIGPAIAAAIEEIINTGQFASLTQLERQIPPSLLDVLAVPGVGVKTVIRLYLEHQIVDLASLESALIGGRLRGMPGFGPKTEAKILAGIESLKRRTGRIRIGIALPAGRRFVDSLARRLPEADIRLAGSTRRMTETIGDLDIVVAVTDSLAVRTAVEAIPEVGEITESDDQWIRVKLISGLEADIYHCPPDTFGSVLVRATGNAEHLSQLGAIPDAATEEAVYQSHGLPWIPPELREGQIEFELARSGQLDKVVTLDDIRGEFHCHTVWSDGACTVEEMAEAAKSRSYRFLGISDHSRSLGVANGLDAVRLREQRVDIDRANRTAGIRIFAGCEVEVDRDGNLDFDDDVLAQLDVVIASLHSGLRQPREQLTDRLIRTLRNPNVDIIAHPSGRLIEQRDAGDFDWDRVFPVAAETGTALEINADPSRLDLSTDLARRALDAGCLLTINCDAHHPDGFANLIYGVSNARKAGALPDQVLNCWPVERIERWLADHRTR
ncbi:MAG TPA: PHP domain-containing protein [Thermomicrobiales bacterium]|nr:PHP domain-containing protein [Thermomicrobiales bacterium]